MRFEVEVKGGTRGLSALEKRLDVVLTIGLRDHPSAARVVNPISAAESSNKLSYRCAQAIAGVRGKELGDARSLGVSDVPAIDDDGAITKFRLVDAMRTPLAVKLQAKLIARVEPGGCFGYTAVLAESAAALNPTVKIARVLAQPDPSKVREFADDVRDGKFVLLIGPQMPLHHAAEAHVPGEKGGIGKILLLMPNSSD